MITPAVLISGAGTLLLSTSNRLGRATDRVRSATARFKVLVGEAGRQEPLAREEKRMIISQLPRLSRRTRYLQRAMRSLYLAVAFFVTDSIWLGLATTFNLQAGVVAAILAISGAAALAYAALLLSFEASLSAITTREEMRFLELMGMYYAELYKDEDELKAEMGDR